MAELFGISRNGIGMIERAEVYVPTDILVKIALALNTHSKVFFDFKLIDE